MFSYEHLAAFCATYEEGSYSGAARKLNKDRTTIREQIKLLEDCYAIQLFSIKGKSAVASSDAENIYQQASLLVRNSEKLDVHMLNLYRQEVTQLDIFHDILVPSSLIVHIEQYIADKHPKTRLNWLHRNRDEALSTLARSNHHLAIMQHTYDKRTDYPISSLNLGSGTFALYANPTHPLCQLTTVSLGELQLEKQYISENHFNAMPHFFQVSPDFRLVSNNDILVELLKKDGWALLSTSLAEHYVETGQLKQLPIKELASSLDVGISFYYPDALASSPLLQEIMQQLTLYVSQHRT